MKGKIRDKRVEVLLPIFMLGQWLKQDGVPLANFYFLFKHNVIDNALSEELLL